MENDELADEPEEHFGVAAGLIAALPGEGFRYGLETALAIVILAFVAAIIAASFEPRGLVTMRRIAQGSVIGDDDVVLVPMPAGPQFRSVREVRGFLAARDLERGQPLRTADLASTYAAAVKEKAAGEVITPGDVQFKDASFSAAAYRDASLVGLTLRYPIRKGALFQRPMLTVSGARRACRDIAPFRILTSEDVADPPPWACSLVRVREGSFLPASSIVDLDPSFETVMTVKIAPAVARTDAGGRATLLLKESKQQIPVQILAAGSDSVTIACRAADASVVAAASDIRAIQEVR